MVIDKAGGLSLGCVVLVEAGTLNDEGAFECLETGTGFRIKPGCIVTAFHVVRGKDKNGLPCTHWRLIFWPDGNEEPTIVPPKSKCVADDDDRDGWLRVKVVEENEGDDWALVEFPEFENEPKVLVRGEMAPKAEFVINRLEEVYVDDRWQYQCRHLDGTLSGEVARVDAASLLQLNVRNADGVHGVAVAGYSGAPVVVGTHVVAMVLERDPPKDAYGAGKAEGGRLFALPISQIPWPEAREPWRGVDPAEARERVQRELMTRMDDSLSGLLAQELALAPERDGTARCQSVIEQLLDRVAVLEWIMLMDRVLQRDRHQASAMLGVVEAVLPICHDLEQVAQSLRPSPEAPKLIQVRLTSAVGVEAVAALMDGRPAKLKPGEVAGRTQIVGTSLIHCVTACDTRSNLAEALLYQVLEQLLKKSARVRVPQVAELRELYQQDKRKFTDYAGDANEMLRDQRKTVEGGSGMLDHHYMVCDDESHESLHLVAEHLSELRIFHLSRRAAHGFPETMLHNLIKKMFGIES